MFRTEQRWLSRPCKKMIYMAEAPVYHCRVKPRYGLVPNVAGSGLERY